MNGSYAVHRYSISASWNCSFPCGKIYLHRGFSDHVLRNYHCMRISCRFVGGSTGGKKQNPEIYMDYLLVMMIPAIIGARIYYVVFSWDSYKDNIPEIFNLRHGGLGIVGGVAMAVLVLFLFAKAKKQSVLLMLDTLTMGLLIGQIMGRWGNFFNREAFGGYTDGPLAMQIPLKYFEQYGRVPELESSGILKHLVTLTVHGEKLSYIQVHPTFLYEGMWNLLLLLFIFIYRKHKKFDGELLCIYLMGYGLGRFFIEGLRVDQLLIGHTGIAVTQVVCICIFVGGLIGMVLGHRKSKAC